MTGHDRISAQQAARCPICDWPFAESREKGCVPGDCSYRPDDPAEQARIARRRKDLSTSPQEAKTCECGFSADACSTNPCYRKKVHLAGMTPDSKWPDTGQRSNTDCEVWRGPDEGNGDYYADSVHVTEGGGIGIDVNGHVIVKPAREWHRLAVVPAAKQNTKLPAESVTNGCPTTQGPGVTSGGSQPSPSELDDSRERPATFTPEEVAAVQHSIMENGFYRDHFGDSPVVAFGLANSALKGVQRRSPAGNSPELEAILKDPAAVHLNMLRGGIAMPSLENIKHLYPEVRDAFAAVEEAKTAEQKRCAEIASQNYALMFTKREHREVAQKVMRQIYRAIRDGSSVPSTEAK